ncbi:hypothetical protein ID866_7305 [Astraeus odoratus]|nr:hypothetical protein ID866_7305 [Astraeus odoratus]
MDPTAAITRDQVNLFMCPVFDCSIKIYCLVPITYDAPSDQSGIRGVHHDIIDATLSWHNSPACYDCVFMDNGGTDKEGFRCLLVVRILLFLAFSYRDNECTCMFVE